MDYDGVKAFMLDKLSKELSPNLYYHDINHTLDVLRSAEILMDAEQIDTSEQIIVKTACVFHDSGMLRTYVGHEEASCGLAIEILPAFNYPDQAIARINRMIMTTKLPQSATDPLEQIICDADLDYLGRNDFFMISHRLKFEWDIHNFKKTTLKEWYDLQVSFLTNHVYFTKAAIESREAMKQQNLREIIQLMNGIL
jgi:predicted metal-dependent HD superfamily phosphohydrolase